MANEQINNSNNTDGTRPQSDGFKHKCLAIQNLTRTANANATSAESTVKPRESDGKSTEHEQKPTMNTAMNTTKSTLTLANLHLTRTTNANATSAEITVKPRQSDGKSTEHEQKPTMNTTKPTLTLANLNLLGESLDHKINHWISEEKKDGGVRFYWE